MLKAAAFSFIIVHLVTMAILLKYRNDIFRMVKKAPVRFRTYMAHPAASADGRAPHASTSRRSTHASTSGIFSISSGTVSRIFSSKITGLPIFATVMFMVFHLTFDTAGRFLNERLASLLELCTAKLDSFLTAAGSCRALHDLITCGICPGIGSVLSFVPVIAVLFLLLALLQDCGYFSHVAVMFDSSMSHLGLSGRCIVPLIMGFGCAVPAVLSASSMLDGREKLRTIYMIPFMSCSARLPVYGVLLSAFFEDHRAAVVWFIYLTGIAAAMICARIAASCTCRGGSAHISREQCERPVCPVLKMPRISYVLDVVITNSLGFVKKAFSVILAASVIIWFLQSFDCSLHMVSDCRDSILVLSGRHIAPFFEPLGFGSWQAASAMIAGLSAKEAMISTFSVIAGSSGTSVFSLLCGIFTPSGALSFMVFCLLYVPCAATLVTVRKETGSWRCSIIMCFMHILAAWCACFVIYNVCSHLWT